MTILKDRKALKYISDIFINPTKSIALVCHPVVLVVGGCISFALAETIHCVAHIRGAWLKNNKSSRWKILKISILAGRLAASLVGAGVLGVLTLLGSTALAKFLVPLYSVAFIVSSALSTFHKIRGLYDHCKSPAAKPGKSTRALALRAAFGVGGLVLSILVIAKVAFIVAFLATPWGIGVAAAMIGGMVIQKAWKVCRYKRQFERKEKSKMPVMNPALSELRGIDSPAAVPKNKIDNNRTAQMDLSGPGKHMIDSNSFSAVEGEPACSSQQHQKTVWVPWRLSF